MPEGDTVHRLALRFAPLVGRTITASDFRVPALATASLVGSVVDDVWAWGKNLYWRCVGERRLILWTHLKMEGTWRIHPVGRRWSLPGHTARVVIRVAGSPDPSAEVEVVGHSLGAIDLFPEADYPRRTAHLGPDPLGPDWDVPGRWPVPGRDEALSRFERAAAQGGTLGETLLDQRVLAGVGNEYRNELCFLLGIHPARAAADAPAARAIDLARTLMGANSGRTERTFTGVDRDGERTWVFGRNHQPCRRCGATIKAGELGGADSTADPRADQGRVIWWCPVCQQRERMPDGSRTVRS